MQLSFFGSCYIEGILTQDVTVETNVSINCNTVCYTESTATGWYFVKNYIYRSKAQTKSRCLSNCYYT